MKVTRRRFVESVLAVGAFFRIVAPHRQPRTVLSVETSEGFVSIAEIRDILAEAIDSSVVERYFGLRRLGPVTFDAVFVPRNDDA